MNPKNSQKIKEKSIVRRFPIPFISIAIGVIASSIDLNLKSISNYDINLSPLTLGVAIIGALVLLINILDEFKDISGKWGVFVKEEIDKASAEFKEVERRMIKSHIKYKKQNINTIKLSAKRGKFIRLDGLEALNYISRNVHNYSEILNIRLRPRIKTDETEDENLKEIEDCIDNWRESLKQAFGTPNVKIKIQEIIYDEPSLQQEAGKMKYHYYQQKLNLKKSGQENKVTYTPYRLEKGAGFSQIRNFMIFKRKDGPRELYWGWYDPEDDGGSGGKSRYNTYYTIDKDMVGDYLDRYKALYDLAKKKPIQKLPN
jgi:hypothetical protein